MYILKKRDDHQVNEDVSEYTKEIRNTRNTQAKKEEKTRNRQKRKVVFMSAEQLANQKKE